MLINGVTEYDKQGRQVKTCLVIARATKDGQRYSTKDGKPIGKTTIIPYTRKDGSPVFLDIVAFGSTAADVSMTAKGDRIIVAGRINEREYNEKSYTDLLVDYFQNLSAKERITPQEQERNLNDLTNTLGGFAEVDPVDDGELPF